jgi:outer membrane lipase/esterase
MSENLHGNPNAAIGSAYSQNYNAQMQVALAAIARNGVRVELVDTSLLGNLIKANPGLYGLSSAGACPLACIGNPALQNQFLFYFDQLHLTSHGFAILGEYIVNRLDAPLTFAPQGDLALNSAMGFASTLFGKLDMFREISGFVPSAISSYPEVTKAPYMKAPVPPPTNALLLMRYSDPIVPPTLSRLKPLDATVLWRSLTPPLASI